MNFVHNCFSNATVHCNQILHINLPLSYFKERSVYCQSVCPHTSLYFSLHTFCRSIQNADTELMDSRPDRFIGHINTFDRIKKTKLVFRRSLVGLTVSIFFTKTNEKLKKIIDRTGPNRDSGPGTTRYRFRENCNSTTVISKTSQNVFYVKLYAECDRCLRVKY